jgi:hypothetical protein
VRRGSSLNNLASLSHGSVLVTGRVVQIGHCIQPVMVYLEPKMAANIDRELSPATALYSFAGLHVPPDYKPSYLARLLIKYGEQLPGAFKCWTCVPWQDCRSVSCFDPATMPAASSSVAALKQSVATSGPERERYN